MLEKVLRHIRNWFVISITEGTFSIEGGDLALPSLLDGQYFRIRGSVFNDGLHKQGETDLTDESFNGEVWALAVPKAVIKLAEDIAAWQEKNAEVLASPYASESFGGYSYTKNRNQSGKAITWEDAFHSELKEWRRI